MSEIKGKKILIVGFGREGRSVLKFLQDNSKDYDISVADKNPEAVADFYFTKYSGDDYLEKISEFDTVIKSPGIPADEVKNAKHVTTPTNIFFENCKNTVIGVSGTKGKSTTGSLIAHILSESGIEAIFMGNVGKPALDYLNAANENTIFVMELSSFQLSDIHYSPEFAVLLPIYHEHMDYHGGFDNYWKAKENITKFQTEENYFIYYEDNELCVDIASRSIAKKVTFKSYSRGSSLLGEANKINIAAAYQVTSLFVKDDIKIAEAIKTFQPLPYRLEDIGTFRGIRFINDSLATIPEATEHAIEALEGTVQTLIAGGYDRGVDFSKLGAAIKNSSVETLILFPTTGDKIQKALLVCDPDTKINIIKTEDMKVAVENAYKCTSKNMTCLLSPASTSFNLFKDYVERGDTFKKYVYELGK